MKKTLGLVIGFVLLVSACGTPTEAADSPSDSPSEVESDTPAVVDSPKPTPKTSSIPQLAGEVASYTVSMESLKAEMDPDCEILEYAATSGQSEGLDALSAFTCFLNKGTASLYADSLAVSLEKLAPYPSEVEALVKETIDKAHAASAVDVGDACNADPESEGCGLALLNYKIHTPGLKKVTAKWGPCGA